MALLADLREGRLIRAPEPAAIAAPVTERTLALVPKAAPVPDSPEWPQIEAAIRNMHRPAIETGYCLGQARQMVRQGMGAEQVMERILAGAQ